MAKKDEQKKQEQEEVTQNEQTNPQGRTEEEFNEGSNELREANANDSVEEAKQTAMDNHEREGLNPNNYRNENDTKTLGDIDPTL